MINPQGQIIDETGKLTGGQVDLATGQMTSPNVTSPISSSTLQKSTPIQYEQPEQVPVPNITPPEPDKTPPASPISNDLDTRINEALGLQEKVAGKEAYKQQLYQQQGLTPTIDENGNTIYQNKTLVDLQNQLKKLSAESLQIPLQLQQQAEGRGITVGGLAPIQTGMLRNNAIASLGVQAQIAGQKDNIVLARGLVEQMVSTKYGQDEANLKVKIANIDLLKQKTGLKKEEEDRADYRALKLKREQNKLDQAKEDTATIASWAIAMGKYQPTDPSKPKPTTVEIDDVMRLAKSNDPDALKKALAIYVKYSNDPQATLKAANELELQRIQIQKTGADAELAKETNPLQKKKLQAEIDKLEADAVKTRAEADKLKLANMDVEPYVAGANATVDSWAERIQNGTAKITEIPASQAALRNQVTKALQAMGNSLEGKPTTTELGRAALDNAKALMTKLEAGTGTGAVGGSRFWVGGAVTSKVPGTNQYGFVNDFNAIKSQLALEGVKYLKGQGQVSDAERALLAQATTKLNLSQSEAEFKSTLQGIIDKLSGNLPATGARTVLMIGPDGKDYNVPSDQVDTFIRDGGKKK